MKNIILSVMFALGVLSCVASAGCAGLTDKEKADVIQAADTAATTATAVAPLLPPPWNTIMLAVGAVATILTGAAATKAVVKQVKDSPEGKIL